MSISILCLDRIAESFLFLINIFAHGLRVRADGGVQIYRCVKTATLQYVIHEDFTLVPRSIFLPFSWFF